MLTRQASLLTNGPELPIYVTSGCIIPIALLPSRMGVSVLALSGPFVGADAIGETVRFAPEASAWVTVLGSAPWGNFIMPDLVMVVMMLRVVKRQARLTGELRRI